MTAAASEESDARPPVAHAAQPSEAAVRPTARPRPRLPVRTVPAEDGFAPDDPYVRRYWVAAIGSAAVAELLRLIRSGHDGVWVLLPRRLPTLLRADLVRVEAGTLVVGDRIPPVPANLRRRFPPGLRESHRRAHEARTRP